MAAESASRGVAGVNQQMTQAELPPLPRHLLAGGSLPGRLAKPFVPPRRAKGGSLSGPRVQASPAENGEDAPRGGPGGGDDAAECDGGNASLATVVPDTQEAEEGPEHRAHQAAVVAPADDAAAQRASSSAAAGVGDAGVALPLGAACASASANPRCAVSESCTGTVPQDGKMLAIRRVNAGCYVRSRPLWLDSTLSACSVEPFGWVRGSEDGSPLSASTVRPEDDAADSAREAAAVCADSEEAATVVADKALRGAQAAAKARAAKPAPRKRASKKRKEVAEGSGAAPDGGQAVQQSRAVVDDGTPAADAKGSTQAAERGRPRARQRGKKPIEESSASRRIPGRLQPWACARCTLENPVRDDTGPAESYGQAGAPHQLQMTMVDARA